MFNIDLYINIKYAIDRVKISEDRMVRSNIKVEMREYQK